MHLTQVSQPLAHNPLQVLQEPLKGIDYSTEHGVATAFSQLFYRDLRYCAAWAKWVVWSGKRWELDSVQTVQYLTRMVCASAAQFCTSPAAKTRLKSAGAVAAVERLARADPKHIGRVNDWDSDVWRLNTPGGIVDLRTGVLGPHDRDHLMMRMANATPQGACPVWMRFLNEVTGGDKAFQLYLQKMAGYFLTGDLSTHALFFLYGTGSNGKSVFVNVISTVLGDYAATAPMETFMHSHSDRHPTDLAGLHGARFVTAVETEQGRRWNESRIKAITAGDPIAVRLMHRDFFTYTPQFKLLIAGNHLPEMRNIDEAMRRRMHLIPFTVTVPWEKRDPHLTEKLLRERDGILAWAVQGCLLWQKDGLQRPRTVDAATAAYFEAEDAIGTWISERCKRGADQRALTATLYNDWLQWAQASGEFPGSQRRFSSALLARGGVKWRNATGVRGYRGIGLKQPTSTPPNHGV